MADLYRLTSPSGKSYIGISVRAKDRWNRHKRDALSGLITPLYTAIRTYGWHNFKKEVLVISDYEYVRDLEIKAIAAFGTKVPNGYNLADGGSGSPGVFQSEETRRKKSEGLMGRKHRPESIKLMSEVQKGRTFTDKSLVLMSKAQKDNWADPGYREARSGENSHMFGRRQTQEMKAKIAASVRKFHEDRRKAKELK